MTVEELSKIMNYLLETGKGHYQIFIPVDEKCISNNKIDVMATDGVELYEEEETVLVW